MSVAPSSWPALCRHRRLSVTFTAKSWIAGTRCYGVGGRGDMYPVDCPKPTRSMPMTEQSAAATAFDHNSTLVLALELSGKGWQVGAVLPGVARRPRRRVAPRDVAGLLAQIERWQAEAQRAGR